MVAIRSHSHVFECQFSWTGAAAGGTVDYASYSRAFRIEIAGKPPILGSAAPVFRGDAALHNPEDLLVASLSACHALSYLALASRAGLVVVAYEDHATGTMAAADGVIRFVEVLLRPKVTVSGTLDRTKVLSLHERAHAQCFIANSVNFPVRNEPSVVLVAPTGTDP